MSTKERIPEVSLTLFAERGYDRIGIDGIAVIAIGSFTREFVKADEYSDLDLIIVTDNPAKQG